MEDHSLYAILEQDIPDAQNSLRESHENLYNVAEYCRRNYLQAGDKKLALEETKSYATQALASVAYQINSLSSHLMNLFDHQDLQLSDMEGQVHHINQTILIHKEKIARREIGALATTNKSMHRQVKLLQPPAAERAIRYTRRNIDYDIYDDLGHGLKISQPQHGAGRHVRKSLSSVTDGSASISSGSGGGGGPNTNYDTSAIYRKTGTLNPGMSGTLTRNQGRNMGDYRTPVPPPPPVVPPMPPPSQYGSAHLSNGRQNHSSTASPRLGQHGRGDHYRTGNMAPTTLSGYPVGSAPVMHQQTTALQSVPSGGLRTPPLYNATPQSGSSQYSSRNEIFRYPVTNQQPPPQQSVQQQQQPVRRLSNGSGGGNYGALPLHHAGQRPIQTAGPPPPPPPPPPPGSGENYVGARNGTVNGYPLTGNGVKTPIRNSTMMVRMNSQTDSNGGNPLPPVGSPDNMHHRNGNGNGHGHGAGDGYADRDREPDWVPKAYLDKVVAIYDYHADKYDELTFMENQIIYVIKKNDDGWFEGVMEGVRGLFPGNYVESCI